MAASEAEKYLDGIDVRVVTKQNTDVAIDFGDSDEDSAPLSSPVSSPVTNPGLGPASGPVSGPVSNEERGGRAINNAAGSAAGSGASRSAGAGPRRPNAAKGSAGWRQSGKARRALVVRFEPETALHVVRYSDGKGPWFFDPEAR